MRHLARCWTGSVAIAVSLLLGACGGGGGAGSGGTSGSAPSSPVLALEVGPRALHFSWDAIPRADFYRLLENPDGASGFSQTGANLAAGQTATRRDVAVHRHDWPNARYLLEACNAAGCTASNEVSSIGALLEAIGYFKASNPDHQDHFGMAVALAADGNTLAVGAPQEDSFAETIDGDQGNDPDPDSTNYGAVYVFARDDLGDWYQQAYVKAPNSNARDRFGETLALSADGDTLAVGAYGEDAEVAGILPTALHNEDAQESGAAYVFVRSNTRTWSMQTYFKASNAESGDMFGRRVALSADGNVLAIGADFEDSIAGGNPLENGAALSGAVYIARRNGSTWSYDGFIKAPAGWADARDFFGYALALSGDGNRLAVGAWGEDSNSPGVYAVATVNVEQEFNAGAVYVYTRGATGWFFEVYVKPTNPGEGDLFGRSVALSGDGNTLAVGAEDEDSGATAIDGDPFNDFSNRSGAAYVFVRDAMGVWSQQAYIKASNAVPLSFFGRSIALSADGDTLAVGADGEPGGTIGIDSPPGPPDLDNSGAVYLFARDTSGAWRQEAYVKAPNTDAEDQFGHAVALSNNGAVLAVGAYTEDSKASGIDGDQQDDLLCVPGPTAVCDLGAVYLY